MIDVLLVLIIVFMVILPTRSTGLPVRAPQEDKSQVQTPAEERALVVTVLDDGSVLLNRDRFGSDEWPAKLRWILAARADRTVFFTADPDAEFQLVGQAIDVARTSGAEQVGLLAKAD